MRAQERAGHGIHVETPNTKRSRKQVGVLFVDDANLWKSLGEDNDIDMVMEKGQRSINSWGNNLLAVGGELRPDKCSYTIHEMKPTKNGKREYLKATLDKLETKGATDIDELDDLWEDMYGY